MKLAILQMQAVAAEPQKNLARMEIAAREAADHGSDLLVVPELAVTGYGAGSAIRALAETADGPAVSRLNALSKETGMAIVAGFAEAAEGAVWNSAVFVDGAREPVIYRKSHLYAEYEKSLFRAETPSSVTMEHAGVKLGLLICYDVEFPENVRRLAQAGCTLVVVPTALPAGDHASFIARQMIPVRAFENQIFIAYANHCGADANFAYAGLSSIAAPDGSVLACAEAKDEALLYADIRPQDFAASAARNTYLHDLRL